MKKQYELVASGYVNTRSIDGVVWIEAATDAPRRIVAEMIRGWRSKGWTIVRSNTEIRTVERPNVTFRII